MRQWSFERLGHWLTRHYRVVLAIWIVAIGIAIPFAQRLPSVISKQGASKLVPGTESAAAERLVSTAFPQRSELQSFVVLSSDNVRAAAVKQLLAGLDERLQERHAHGDLADYYSLLNLYQDATRQYLEQARKELDGQSQEVLRLAQAIAADPELAQVVTATGELPPEVSQDVPAQWRERFPRLWPLFAAGTPSASQVQLALIDEGQRTGDLKPELAALLREMVQRGADDRALKGLAKQFVATSDWQRFPIEVPPHYFTDLVSPDGRTTVVLVTFAKGASRDLDVGWLRETTASLLAALPSAGRPVAQVTGDLALIQDTYQQAESDYALMEIFAYSVIVIVLLLFFRSLTATLLTVAMIVLAMFVSQAALYALGQRIAITQYTLTIMNFAMLGAGIDYSMLLSARYRQERRAGKAVPEAVARATAHAGHSVLLAGTAVILAFGATLFSAISWIPPLGYGGIIGVLIILLAALTLTPSLLMVFGDRFFSLGIGAMGDLEHHGALGKYLRRTMHLVAKAPLAVLLLFSLFTLPTVAALTAYRPTADPVALSAESESLAGFRLVARQWGDSWLFPTVIVAQLDRDSLAGGSLNATGHEAVDTLSQYLARVRGVDKVQSLTQPFGKPLSPREVTAVDERLRRDYLSPSGVVRLVVTLKDPPFSPEGIATVRAIERAAHGYQGGTERWLVGGATKTDLEYNQGLQQSFWRMIVFITVGIFVLLAVALRSLLVPLRLILTIMMSNAWAVALTVLIFQVILHQSITSDVPIFLTVLMMGLGMDYEIFLVTRVREHVLNGQSDRDAVVQGVLDTGRVINAAGLIMAGALGSMALSSTPMMRQYGVALGTAVLLDATIVRMTLVPATLLLFHRYNWWMPAWLKWRMPAWIEAWFKQIVSGRRERRASALAAVPALALPGGSVPRPGIAGSVEPQAQAAPPWVGNSIGLLRATGGSVRMDEVPLPWTRPFRIGRHRTAELRLFDPGISRYHARIDYQPLAHAFVLSDLQSTNGVYVNGRTVIAPTPLRHGDQIELGGTDPATFAFELRPAAVGAGAHQQAASRER